VPTTAPPVPQVSNKTGRMGILDCGADEAVWQQPNRVSFELRPKVSGTLLCRLYHLVSEAALTRGARQAFFDRVDHTRRSVTDQASRSILTVASSTGR
jgi:hypothetical protein